MYQKFRKNLVFHNQRGVDFSFHTEQKPRMENGLNRSYRANAITSICLNDMNSRGALWVENAPAAIIKQERERKSVTSLTERRYWEGWQWVIR